MDAPLKFRAAFHGFNREDVVGYLEYLNNKHQSQLAQLNTQVEALQAQLREREDQGALIASLQAENAALTQRLAENAPAEGESELVASLQAECAALTAQLEAAQAPGDADLSTYRRAERTEREAKQRAELVYFQAKSVLAEAISQVEGATLTVNEAANQAMSQLTRLQAAVGGSKRVLQEAASLLGAIRPDEGTGKG